MKPIRNLSLALAICISAATLQAEDAVRPDHIKFRRQAAVRLVFDPSQAIPLSSLRPATITDLDLMHPEMEAKEGPLVQWKQVDGILAGTAPETGGTSLRWLNGAASRRRLS
ncbi:MAG: hypothetical protein H7A52_10750 [Akkermansiaceae bacterium]|nr:hypothetical protein [Akkermansiaceae bacterium]